MPIGAKGISMVDVRDIGDAAARELLRREEASELLPRELYELVGPDAVNADFVTAAWSDALGRPVRYGGGDIDAFEARLKGAAPAWLAFDMRLMMQRYLAEGAVATPQQIERMTSLLGRAPRSYRDFAAETASEWASR